MACDIQIEKIIFKSKKTYIDEHHYHHDLLMICLSFSMPHWFHNLCFWKPFLCPWNFLRIKKPWDLPLTVLLENWRQSSLQCWEPRRPGTLHATGIYPPENRKIGLRRTSNTGDFFSELGRFICWVFWDSHKIHLGRLASFDVSFFCFFASDHFF